MLDASNVPPEGLDLATLAARANVSIEEILDASDDDLADLPDGIRNEVENLRQARKDALEAEAQARQQRVQALGQRLKGEFDRRVGLRQQLELRWLSDIRQYNGEYDAKTKERLNNRKYGSTVFVPLTRRVCNIVEARLGDLLYPTDDRNFAISSTPVPELIEAEALARRMNPTAVIDVPGSPPVGPADGPQDVPRDTQGTRIPAAALQMGIREVREEAKSAADAMQREVDDQLKTANWGKVGREVIHDGLVMGTGIMKGPFVLNRTKKSWTVRDGVGKLSLVEDLSPTCVRVSPWDFFPDMAARTLAESESEFERHFLNRAEMAKLAMQPGFDAGAIAMVLSLPPPPVNDYNREALREASGTIGAQEARYQLLEYHGPIERQDLIDCGCKHLPDDNLTVYTGVVFMTPDGIVVKAIVNPMSGGERPYSVWCWQKDQGSIFGFGLPHECSDLQDVANSSFRAALDNLGLAVGPQIVVNSKLIQPHNGDWTITPNKIWEMIKAEGDARMAFAFFQVESRITELLAVFNGAKALLDEIAGPQLAMQGQEASLPRTDFQASVAYNASNIWMRRAVRNWDDDITTPTIQRFVDWNMEFNPKKEIKGDALVQARGTTALLEAEGQAQRMAMFMATLKDVPMPYAKKIAQAREMAKAMRIDPVDVLPTAEEAKELGQKIDNQQTPPSPEQQRLELRKIEVGEREKDRAHTWAIERVRLMVRMAEIASKEQITREQAEAKYGIELAKIDEMVNQRLDDNRKFNAETVLATSVSPAAAQTVAGGEA